MTSSAPSSLLDPLFGTTEVAAFLDDRARLQGMLDFEAALARAEAAVGVIPAAAAEPIAARCRAELFDLAALGEAAALAGNPAIPMVKRLTALVAETDETAARYVHWGATSQDAMDTGLVLQLRACLVLLEADLDRLEVALADLARRHRDTLMVGRTWLQQALPLTFGLKAAGWLDAVLRHHERLRALRPRLLVLQFGGAVGTLASLGGRGLEVTRALAQQLDLAVPDLPWHAHRDRLAELAAWLGLLAGSLGKMARDLALLMQTEVAEAFEPAAPGKGGSSTMPHKRNPVGAAVVLSAAIRAPGLVATLLAAMPQEHERGLGGWHAEWQTLPELALLAAGALRRMVEIVEGLEVDPVAMRAGLETTRGLIMAEAVQMALGAKLGRQQAHALLERATKRAVAEGRDLGEVLRAMPEIVAELSAPELDRLLDPATYTGEAGTFVDRALAARERGA
ncbi:3-carboxy-cis,cis-muconate cycloisomerase [Benzoatithermus flavus]|uniref:3-carboxy-cis,cis-muconate cycloisomerase n=1 Tax=Benzoatithermus flavus TaxID=3108223 RepID=A0ABU8XUM0_9PROT